jgi:NAD(P)-dependent dehydrogenase (short-subunit alcohol dehydrogenase family)
VDVLVNNAALMSEMQHSPLAEYPLEEWERVMRVNVTGALLCSQAVVPSMRARGGGRIINQSSAGAFGGGGAYGVSKLALIGLTVALARELGPLGITVNAIAPGLVADDAGYRSLPRGSAIREALKAQLPLQGHPEGTPEDLLGALLLLASPAGDWITGQTLHVDGGWILRP